MALDEEKEAESSRYIIFFIQEQLLAKKTHSKIQYLQQTITTSLQRNQYRIKKIIQRQTNQIQENKSRG
ncbi:MAG: hypothetical protein IJ258_03260 [Methanobrevibacter sp.]|uniref:hypothetical protein n=1 Tax=Methanobrevibacter sp. TaxID=66852 RepID=UPI002600E413|nr:hypothetical protein [Methanobrevibacter sp.]MBQ8017105.1 hypothetical protein [Methanobrevibacter sp.]